MALQDFIQSLQDNDTVYSTPPQPSIRVIPPENQCIKVIPPENQTLDSPAPKVIKLKIKQKPIEDHTQNLENQVLQTVNQPMHVESKMPSTITTPVVQQTQEIIPTYTPPSITEDQKSQASEVNENHILTDDEIFNSTGTEYSKKELWFHYFDEAKRSRKSNVIAERMKKGRFTITPDNKVLLLPDYDIVGKDPDDVLKDKWF